MVAQPVEHNQAELAPIEEHAPVSRDQRVLLDRVSWELFEQILAADPDRRVPRLAYDDGALELMTPSSDHEHLGSTVASLIDRLAEEWRIESFATGAVTMKSDAFRRATEPDSSFYIQHYAVMRSGVRPEDPGAPPPDLVVEIELSRDVIARLPILAALGVPEVWRVRDDSVTILALSEGHYHEVANSLALPLLSAVRLNELLQCEQELSRLEWLSHVREWAAEASGQ
ncbi:MAG: Uma2 family endonuclease [Thermomicrobiales bacterium]